MSIVAQGQITIVDHNDYPSLLMSIGSNKTKIFTKTFNYAGVASYEPTLGTGSGQAMEIVPSLYLAGSNSELFTTGDTTHLQFLKWDIIIDGTTYTVTPSDTRSSGAHSEDVNALYNKGITFSALGTTGHLFNNAKITCSQNSGIGTSFYVKAYAQYRYRVSAGDPYTSISADYEVTTIEQAADAYTVALTNSNHTFPISIDESGVGTFRTNSHCFVGVEIKYGFDDVTAYHISCDLQGDTRFDLAYYEADGVTPATSSSDYQVVRITPKTGSGIGTTDDEISDGGTFPITIYCGDQTFVRQFTWTAANAGANGADGVSYNLAVSPREIRLIANSNGTYSIGSNIITLSPTKYAGDSKVAWTSYRIAAKPSNGVWAILNSTQYTPGVDDGVIEFRLFEAADMPADASSSTIANSTAYIDIETAVVTKAPLDTALITVESSGDPTFRNGEGDDIVLTTKFYVNAVDSTSSYTKTWKKNGTVISGQTGSTLTVTPSMVESSAYFTCEVTYQGKIYIDGQVIRDFTDPYTVELYSTQGDTFINGVGSTDITCIIRRYSSNEVTEIDPYSSTSGHTYLYNYNWYLLDSSGNKPSSPTYTGKKITVQASEISTKGTIVCEVVTK